MRRGALVFACAVTPLVIGLLTPFAGFFSYALFIGGASMAEAAARAAALHGAVGLWSYTVWITLLPFVLMSAYLALWSPSLGLRKCVLAQAVGLICALAGLLPAYFTIWSVTAGAAIGIVAMTAAALWGRLVWPHPGRERA